MDFGDVATWRRGDVRKYKIFSGTINETVRYAMSVLEMTVREFGELCAGSYLSDGKVGNGYHVAKLLSGAAGFRGVVYRHRTRNLEFIVAYTGTENCTDVSTWPGFGGDLAHPPVAPIDLTGPLVLQLGAAISAVREVRNHAEQLVLTGHSLGGGLAACVAALFGFRALTISSPTVSRVPNVMSGWARTRAPICNIVVQHDPINTTETIGQRPGRSELLASSRRGRAAHDINLTVLELSGSPVGALRPFHGG